MAYLQISKRGGSHEETWRGQEIRAFCVLEFAKTESIVTVQWRFRTKYHREPPTRVLETFIRSPQKSTNWASQELQMPQSSVWHILLKHLCAERYQMHTLNSLGQWLQLACSFHSAQAATLPEFLMQLMNYFDYRWFYVVLGPKPPLHSHNWLSFGKFQDTERFLIPCPCHVSSRLPPSGATSKYVMVPITQTNLERFSTHWYVPFYCVCLGCCATEFRTSRGNYELPCTKLMQLLFTQVVCLECKYVLPPSETWTETETVIKTSIVIRNGVNDLRRNWVYLAVRSGEINKYVKTNTWRSYNLLDLSFQKVHDDRKYLPLMTETIYVVKWVMDMWESLRECSNKGHVTYMGRGGMHDGAVEITSIMECK
jgi:hypothetical protein